MTYWASSNCFSRCRELFLPQAWCHYRLVLCAGALSVTLLASSICSKQNTTITMPIKLNCRVRLGKWISKTLQYFINDNFAFAKEDNHSHVWSYFIKDRVLKGETWRAKISICIDRTDLSWSRRDTGRQIEKSPDQKEKKRESKWVRKEDSLWKCCSVQMMLTDARKRASITQCHSHPLYFTSCVCDFTAAEQADIQKCHYSNPAGPSYCTVNV